MKTFVLLTFISIALGINCSAQFNSKITNDKFDDYVDSLKTTENSYIFPIWGDKVQDMGYDLPLPLGLMLGFMHMNQDLNIENLHVGIGDSELVDISELVVFDKINNTTNVLTFRPDLWLFPFMNVYGIVNKFDARTDLSLSEPIQLLIPQTQNSGYGGGFGTSLAYGIEPLWFSGNFNWAWSKTPALITATQSFSTSLRIGTAFHDKQRKHTISVWVGASYLDYKGNSGGTYDMLNLIPDEPELIQDLLEQVEDALEGLNEQFEDFCSQPQNKVACGVITPILEEFKQAIEDKISGITPPEELNINYTFNNSPLNNWNMVAGAQYHFNKRWEVRVEAGFIGRTSIMVNMNYRLGIKRRK